MSTEPQHDDLTVEDRDEVIRALRESGLVDAAWYRQAYPDIAESGIDPVAHYVEYGAAEGRDPNSHFDTEFYLNASPDVRDAGINPLLHYVTDGAEEGRRTSTSFDTAYYLSENPDVSSTGMNPLVHYLTCGLREGRLPRHYPFAIRDRHTTGAAG